MAIHQTRTMLEQSMKWYGITTAELAKMLRMSERTLYRRLADKDSWTLGELKRLRGIFQWTEEQLNAFVA